MHSRASWQSSSLQHPAPVSSHFGQSPPQSTCVSDPSVPLLPQSAPDGECDGDADGLPLGLPEGDADGEDDGDVDGLALGLPVGACVGVLLGLSAAVGSFDGSADAGRRPEGLDRSSASNEQTEKATMLCLYKVHA